MFSIFFFWKIIQIVVRFANAERIHVGPSSARRPVVCTQSGRGLSRTATTIVVGTRRKGVQPSSYPGQQAAPPSSLPVPPRRSKCLRARRRHLTVAIETRRCLVSTSVRFSVFLTPPVTDVSAGRLLLLYSLHLLNAAAAVSQYQDPIFVIVSA